MDGSAGSSRLSAVDLLVGVSNVPVRILEQLFVQEEGRPDALWFALSSGRDFTLRHRASYGCHQLYERDTLIPWADETEITGLSHAVLKALGMECWAKYQEDMAEVES